MTARIQRRAMITASAALLLGAVAPLTAPSPVSPVPPAAVDAAPGADDVAEAPDAPETPSVATATSVRRPAQPAAPAPLATARVDRLSARYTDPAGTTSTYHLFAAAAGARPAGLVVYLDGDGMYGHRHPNSTWALGGRGGVVAQAAARGYATLSVLTPDRRGERTFWENGRVNAAYVASLTARIRAHLGVQRVWLVGYSGGSQLITKYLLPRHPWLLSTGGGAVITGGGGRPPAVAALGAVTPAAKAAYPLLWYTGSLDDGRNTDDGYDALADAKRGFSWYRGRGFRAVRQEPAGLDHNDLGTRFGRVLGAQLDRQARSRVAYRTS